MQIVRKVRIAAVVGLDGGPGKAEHGRMLYRVLEKHAPSRLLTATAAVGACVIGGLECGLSFFAAIVSLEAGQWLDRYRHSPPGS